ncbi:MAG TPA: alpha/beta hydrolase [Gammaproteobacteria bacterium]|nr:alpha/beta hydrolase [Gammaproteobacteria bacterium]
MRSQNRLAKIAQSILSPLLLAGVSGITTTALAQSDAATAITKLTTIDVKQIGRPPTGPYRVVVEHDPGLATHTIYRPSELSLPKHPVLVWGEGACVKNGLSFPKFLSEIASHGFVVIADGPPLERQPNGPNGPGPQAGVPPPGAPAPGGAGPPADRASMVNGTALVAALDWLEAQNAKRDSRFYGKVDVRHVAAMGMSCGGLMAYGASSDPRVSTVGIWNSGLFPNESDPKANAKIYGGIHGSVIIVTGGESDIAHDNGKRDFDLMPAKVPTFYGVYPSVGHGGTYNQDNGGAFGVTAVAWLKWQLMGDTSATGRGYFVGDACGICNDSNWKVASRALR